MNCPSCGTDLVASARFCGSCGYQMSSSPAGAALHEASPYGASAYPSSTAPQYGYAATESYALASVPSYEQIAAAGVDLPIGEIFGEAWDVTRQNLGMLIAGMFIMGLLSVPVMLVLMVIGLFPLVGPMVQSVVMFALGGPFIGGFVVVALRACAGRAVQLGDFFSGFRKFGPLAVAYLVSSLLASVPAVVIVIPLAIAVAAMGDSGLWLLWLGVPLVLLPTIYLSLAFMWTLWLVIDRNESFWPAMMGSMKVVNRAIIPLLLLGIVMCVVHMAGALTVLGMFITAPFLLVVTGVTFRRLFGIAGGAEHLG